MNNFFRALIAGYGAKKLGGGCFSTIIIFVVIYVLLGKCGNNTHATPLHKNISAKAYTLPAAPKTQLKRF